MYGRVCTYVFWASGKLALRSSQRKFSAEMLRNAESLSPAEILRWCLSANLEFSIIE